MRDIGNYIAECWATAVAIRERQNAMMALVAALAALPIIWLFGGKPELTSLGIAWAAAWATLSAFLDLFVIAPFFMWREDRRRGLDASGYPHRVGLIEFARSNVPELAANDEKAGFLMWDFTLCVGQGALDGCIEIDGKLYTGIVIDPYLYTKRLLPIPKSNWSMLKVDCSIFQFNENKNENVLAWSTDQNVTKYRDLHFRNAESATKWFADAWPVFKGITYQKYLEERAAKAARKEASEV